MNIGENIKNLRKERNVSQEKLANYLNVSFQAVSKWENGNTCPDLSLLPDIARFFGITVDELLQVEKLDEERLYREYEARAEALFQKGDHQSALALWQEAYHKMPNKIEVKEMLMSSFFDCDMVKYQKQIIELGMEIYNSNAESYYKGQAIREIARTYAAIGDKDSALKWAKKSMQLMHSQDILYTEISDGEELLKDTLFCIYWMFRELHHMAKRIQADSVIAPEEKERFAYLDQCIEELEQKFK